MWDEISLQIFREANHFVKTDANGLKDMLHIINDMKQGINEIILHDNNQVPTINFVDFIQDEK